MKRDKRNRVRCTLCNVVIESLYRWHMKWCPCHNTAVDGGLAYRKVLGNAKYVMVVHDDDSETPLGEEY